MGLAGFELTSASEKVPMHTDRTASCAVIRSKASAVIQLACRSERHGVGKRRSPLQTHGDTALEISRNQQRQLGISLQTVQQLSSFVRLIPVQKWRLKAHRHGERPDVIFLHLVAKLEVLGAVHVEKFRPHPDHEKLPDLFFERQLARRSSPPIFHLYDQGGWARSWNFSLAKAADPMTVSNKREAKQRSMGTTIAEGI